MITASVSASAANSVKRVDEAGADQRIAADADARRLSHALLRQLVDRFVGQRAALRDDADAPLAADVAGDDARLALPGCDDARTVGSDQARAPCRP